MGRFLTISIAVGCIVMMPGCRSVKTPPPIVALPLESAPVIPLQLASYSKPTRIEVNFDDQRPDFERLYYPGTCEPRNWRDAMSVVPMESFAPSIEDELRQRVANSIKANDPITARATVILTSFQFALDDREDIQGEYNAKYANWAAIKEEEDYERESRREAASQERLSRKHHDQNFYSCENEDSNGSKLMGELIGKLIGKLMREVLTAGFTSLFSDLPRSKMRKEAARKRTTAEPQTLPSAITDGKRTGLNCQIHATIIFINRDGSEEQQSVRVNNYAPLTADGSMKEQTAEFIEAALEEFSASL